MQPFRLQECAKYASGFSSNTGQSEKEEDGPCTFASLSSMEEPARLGGRRRSGGAEEHI